MSGYGLNAELEQKILDDFLLTLTQFSSHPPFSHDRHVGHRGPQPVDHPGDIHRRRRHSACVSRGLFRREWEVRFLAIMSMVSPSCIVGCLWSVDEEWETIEMLLD